MKPTFDRLPDEKRTRVIEACVREFAEKGFDEGSTEGICRLSGISKGGLYEYIDGKEELFLLAIDSAYDALYGHIRKAIRKSRKELPRDVLERFMRVSEIAIDFYIGHPGHIELIQKANALSRPDLRAAADSAFRARFDSVFGDLDCAALRFQPSKVLDLLCWLLLKTRNDFLAAFGRGGSAVALKRAYLSEWRFYLDALRGGIYRR